MEGRPVIANRASNPQTPPLFPGGRSPPPLPAAPPRNPRLGRDLEATTGPRAGVRFVWTCIGPGRPVLPGDLAVIVERPFALRGERILSGRPEPGTGGVLWLPSAQAADGFRFWPAGMRVGEAGPGRGVQNAWLILPDRSICSARSHQGGELRAGRCAGVLQVATDGPIELEPRFQRQARAIGNHRGWDFCR